MKFTNPNDGLTYFVDCKHETFPAMYNTDNFGNVVEISSEYRTTTCEIYRFSVEGDYSSEIEFGAVGVAVCHPQDPFVRRKGIQLAVSRALSETNWDKETRAKVWNVVWNGKYSKQKVSA